MTATVSASEQQPPAPGEAPPPAAGGEDDELRAEAIARLQRQRKFAQDALGYVAVNAVLWLIWALTDRSSGGLLPWPAWVTLIWGVFVVADGWKAFGRWPRGLNRAITEADVERELRRLRGS